jgi:hypothetical protein
MCKFSTVEGLVLLNNDINLDATFMSINDELVSSCILYTSYAIDKDISVTKPIF